MSEWAILRRTESGKGKKEGGKGTGSLWPDEAFAIDAVGVIENELK